MNILTPKHLLEEAADILGDWLGCLRSQHSNQETRDDIARTDGCIRALNAFILTTEPPPTNILHFPTTTSHIGECQHGTPFCYFCEACMEDDEPEDHAKAV